MRAGRLVRRVGVGRTLPEGEGRPGYKGVAVTYAATIVPARATSSLVANHRCRSVPGPLCGCSRLSNMISSYSQPRLAAAFVPTSFVRAGARVTDRAAGHGFDQPRNGAAGVKRRGRLRSSTGRRRARLSGRRSGTGGSRKTPSGVIQDFHSPDYVQDSGGDHRLPGIAGILARVDHGRPSAARGLEARVPRRPLPREAAGTG